MASRQRPAPLRMAFTPGVDKTDEKVTIVGASGYIGKAVVRECVRRGYATTAVTRPQSSLTFDGATTARAESENLADITQCFKDAQTQVVICCLASRSGTEADSLKVDYEASVNCLKAAQACGARHFVLLSAFCVAKPDLGFQVAKLKTEAALKNQNHVTWTSVRPTAFFKSLSGQVEIVRGGGPFVYFDLGGGRSATCNPISEADLAMAIVDCVADPARSSAGGEPIWNVGGPDAGVSMKSQGELIADAIAAVDGGERKEPWLLPVPIGVFDGIVGAIKWVYDLTGADSVRDAWELGRLGAITPSRTCSRRPTRSATARCRCGSTTRTSRRTARSTTPTPRYLRRTRDQGDWFALRADFGPRARWTTHGGRRASFY